MKDWPPRPVIYEINTWHWLSEREEKQLHPLNLGNLPEEAWEDLARRHVDAIWFMGVWERSDLGRELLWNLKEIRLTNPSGIIGSPYCIKNYIVDERLGGNEGLKVARDRLREGGMKLILDFVPNHTAPDHPWTESHPEFYVSGETLDRESTILCGRHLFAKGKDPFFPPWPDVVQLNAFNEGYRQKAAEVLREIAQLCDGVRCDMAMLLLNEVFENTWGEQVGKRPREEFWSQVIGMVKEQYPSFLFLAEVYWGKEGELLKLGFDYCYDKVLYDILREGDVPVLRRHLSRETGFQDHLLRFLENHDEERAAHIFPSGQLKAANVIVSTLPGALLFYHGQWEGRRLRVPIYASVLPIEEPNGELQTFYGWIQSLRRREILQSGKWELLPPFQVWSDNRSGENLIAWMWTYGTERLLVIVNYSPRAAQGRLDLPAFKEGRSGLINLIDLVTGELYPRSVQEITSAGLFVDLPAWGYHLFHFFWP
ncbi:MAG: alpha-amylase family glycosyl hydrolase [Syntrophales bacterium]|nr:alpha-amylase family glycosyl hydrolase [Syntrophales bacterium]